MNNNGRCLLRLVDVSEFAVAEKELPRTRKRLKKVQPVARAVARPITSQLDVTYAPSLSHGPETRGSLSDK